MKKLLLFNLILFISGCSTEVTLQINADKVNEKIKIYELKSKAYPNNVINEDIESNIAAFEREYEFYDMEEFEELDYIAKTYEFSESIELWSELSHLRPCYEKFELSKTDFNLSLNTSDEYRCGYLYGATDVLLTVESDLELISSNADRVEGNKLIWDIDSSNYKNKSIKFNYQLSNSKNSKINDEYLTYIVLIISVCLIIGLIIFIKKRNNENNSI